MEETKQCPYCGKTILAVANKCKHCNQWIEGVEMEICPVCHELIPRNQDICPYCKEDIKKFLVESRKETDSIRVLDKKQAESHDDSNKTSNYHLFKNDSRDYIIESVWVISILLITIILFKIVLRVILHAGPDL